MPIHSRLTPFDASGSSDNGPALNASLQYGGVTTLAGPGVYKTLMPITIADGAKLVIEPGAKLTFPADMPGATAVTVGIGGRLEGQIQGPGNTAVALGQAPCQMDGILARDKALLRDVTVNAFRAGINVVGNHQRFYSIRATDNFANVAYGAGALTFGDQTFIDADLTGAKWSSIWIDPSSTIDNAEFIGGHAGWAPYGIYRPAGNGKDLLTSTRFVGFAFETIGNAAICDDSKTHAVSDCTFLGAGTIWNSAYRLPDRDADVLIDVGILEHTDFYGITTFQSPGNVAVVRARAWTDCTWNQAAYVIAHCKAAGKPLAAPPLSPKGVYLIGADGRYVGTTFVSASRLKRFARKA